MWAIQKLLNVNNVTVSLAIKGAPPVTSFGGIRGATETGSLLESILRLHKPFELLLRLPFYLPQDLCNAARRGVCMFDACFVLLSRLLRHSHSCSQAVGVAGEVAVDWSSFSIELIRHQDASFVHQLVSVAQAASDGEAASRLQTNKVNQRAYAFARAQAADIVPVGLAAKLKGTTRVVRKCPLPLAFTRCPSSGARRAAIHQPLL